MKIHDAFEMESGCFAEALGKWPRIDAIVRRTPAGTAYLSEPGVVMVAKPEVNEHQLGRFISDLGFGDDCMLEALVPSPAAALIKLSGQLCYMSFGPGRTRNADAQKYLDHILLSGHGSVLEHAQFSFLLYGVSRSFTHELVRHRAGCAFSQVSQRYVSGKVLRFVERPEYVADPELHALFEGRIDRAAFEYEKLSEQLAARQKEGDQLLSGEAKTELRKKVQQTARSLLPNETEAPIMFSANVRALRHIIEMRSNPAAETEIRRVFYRVFLCMAMVEPLLFADYSIVGLPDGTKAVEAKYRKV